MDNMITLSELIRELQFLEKDFGNDSVVSIGACKGNFAMAWNIFYKRLTYKGHINLKIRKGKSKSNQPLIDMLKSSEYPTAIKIATAMCEQVDIDTGEVINKANMVTA